MYDDLFSTLSHWSTGFGAEQTGDHKSSDDIWLQPQAHDVDDGALYLGPHAGQTSDGQPPVADSYAQGPWTSDTLDYQLQQYQAPVDTHDFTDASHQMSEDAHFFAEGHHQTGEDAHFFVEDLHQTGKDAHFFADKAHNVQDLDKQTHAEHNVLMSTDSSSHHRGTETLLGQHYPTQLTPSPELPMTDPKGNNPPIDPNDLHLCFAPSEPPHYDHILTPYIDPHPWTLGDFHGVGHPDVYSHDWQQQTGEDCTVIAQGDVLASITGHMLSEHQLCEEAISHHLYDPRTGTPPDDLGKLLALHGIPVERHEHATFDDLVHALQNNQRVIVGVNANGIWFPHRDVTTGEPAHLPYAGHAVWVTGISTSQAGTKVILSDSGPANGSAEAVDIRDFLNAWHDTDNMMVATTCSYPPA
jgi:hypothetical protein